MDFVLPAGRRRGWEKTQNESEVLILRASSGLMKRGQKWSFGVYEIRANLDCMHFRA
jgi:hypothetical protein